MDVFHHAVEDACSLVDLFLDNCTKRQVLEDCFHVRAQAGFTYEKVPCSSVFKVAAETTAGVETLLSRLTFLVTCRRLETSVEGLQRFSVGRYRTLLAGLTLGWQTGAPQPHLKVMCGMASYCYTADEKPVGSRLRKTRCVNAYISQLASELYLQNLLLRDLYVR